jgi:hypothetical protein
MQKQARPGEILNQAQNDVFRVQRDFLPCRRVFRRRRLLLDEVRLLDGVDVFVYDGLYLLEARRLVVEGDNGDAVVQVYGVALYALDGVEYAAHDELVLGAVHAHHLEPHLPLGRQRPAEGKGQEQGPRHGCRD